MKAIKRQAKSSYFVPDYRAKSLLDIDFKALHKSGVRFIAFDADSTLVPFAGTILAEEIKIFLQAQRQLFDGWCIASNRIFDDLDALGKSIDAPIIQAHWFARKPRRIFFQRVIDLFGAKPEQTAMIGDKLFADMWGAKRAGMTTVWVEHLGVDNPWDRLFRTRNRELKIFNRYSKT